MKPKLICTHLLPLIFASLLACSTYSEASENISADDANIHYQGILFVTPQSDGSVSYQRFTDPVYQLSPARTKKGETVAWKKAHTTPCVKMLFKTSSPVVKLTFKTPPDHEHRGANFGIYQNGKWWKSLDFSNKTRDMELVIQSQTPGEPTLYTIAFPSWSDPAFYGMDLENGHSLETFTPAKKKTYVAYGDSVSHGTGQKSASYLTWPYQLAEKLDYEIYSLAVGGASIRLPVIEMFDQFEKIDLITIYIGINDSGRKSLEQFEKEYDQMLSIIRKNHPDTKIFCITLHAIPADKTSQHTGINLIDFRKPVATVVTKRQAQGDKNLFLIDGQSLTTLDDAMNPGNVHLSIDGAKHWAEKLYPQIKKSL
ncbi:MAG: SGNH/GDSL hydrolase family protein [Verrucomicrobiales bacterium]|nr:SGNH/GDSL hydrolase family protein [Verrucomicrobiales bacterium]